MSAISRSAAALFCAGMMLLPLVASASSATPEERFKAIDANNDAQLSWPEFQAASPNISEKGFNMMDTNADSFLSREEWSAFMADHGIKRPSGGMGGMGGMTMPPMGKGGQGMGGAGMPPMGMMGEMPHDMGKDAPASQTPLIMPPASAPAHEHEASAAPASSAPLIMPPQD